MNIRVGADSTVVVETLSDIKRVIQEFMPSSSEADATVSAEFVVDGQKMQVSAPTSCTYRKMLLDGFEIVRKRIDVVGKIEQPHLANPLNVDGHMWLDDLIKRRLGGIREGLRVRWTLSEGVFYFDPFAGKLTKC